MAEEFELEPEAPPESSSPSETAKSEILQFNKPEPKPNTALVRLWKDGHLTFNPESSVAMFAILALVGLLAVAVLIAILGAIAGDATWVDTIMGALGHAIALVIGAMVGGAVAKKDDQ